MHKKYLSYFILIFNFSAFYLLFTLNLSHANQSNMLEETKNLRIISLAPSTTETIIALGLEDSLIGISSYCQIPDHIPQDLPRLGTAKFFSTEAVLELKPDYVFGIETIAPEHIPYISVPSKSLDDVINAFHIISRVYNKEAQGIEMASELKLFIAKKQREFALSPRKKILFVLGGLESSNGVVNKIVAAGNDGYFSELLNILNAENAIKTDISYPVLSFEMLYNANPDVIIEIHPVELKHLFSFTNWENMPLNAVKNKKVFISHNGLVPGPRFKIFLEEMARFLE